MSLADRDKPGGILAARRFVDLGFAIVATAGTAEALARDGVPVAGIVPKIGGGLVGWGRPHRRREG